jgi:putative membrane protein
MARMGWTLEPTQLVPIALAAALYARRFAALRRRGRPPPAIKAISFAAAMAVLVLALVSPIDSIGEERLFSVHMTQHLLIGDLAPLLVALGLSGPLLRPVLAIGVLWRARALTHPLVALPLWALSLYAWHLEALYVGSVDHPALHALQHTCFVGFGMAMWMPLFGPLPKPAWFGNAARLVYILAVRLTGAVLANVLVWSQTVLYPRYAGDRGFGISPLEDQNAAGAIMMVEGSILTIGLFCWLFLRSAREGEERQELLDLAAARGVELTDRSAARAVAAGRGAELRERLEAGG